VTVTSFGGYTVMDISGAAWSWHNVTRSSAVDVSATDYLEYVIYFSSASTGDQVEWHVTAPDGQEWNGTYQWLEPLSIDGVPDSTPYNMSQNAWHTIELDCSAKSWWSTASTTMRYIKWQLPEDSTVYIRKVRFYSD